MERTADYGRTTFGDYLGYARAGIKRFFKEDYQLWISFQVFRQINTIPTLVSTNQLCALYLWCRRAVSICLRT